MLGSSDVTVVPASPAMIVGRGPPARRSRPACPSPAANRQAASTFGPIEPAANWQSPRARRAWRAGSPAASACPSRGRPRRRRSRMTNRSASSSRASSSVARSLSITASTPIELAVVARLVHRRDAAAAGADHDRALLEQPLDRAELEDPLRQRRGHDAAPLVAVRLERPALLRREPFGLGLVVDRADELGRVLEGRDRRGRPRPSSAAWRAAPRTAAGCRAPARSCSRSCPRSRRRARRAGRPRPRV